MLLYQGDCLEVMKQLPDASIDMILTDLPYDTTHCKWDKEIPLAPLWEQYKRLIKPGGAIVLHAQQPFTSKLVLSNLPWFKYMWVWEKNRTPNFMMAKYAPLKTTEDIVVFSNGGINTNTKNKMVYYPQGLVACDKEIKSSVKKQGVNIYNCLNKRYRQTQTAYPKNLIKFACEAGLHPTQKPVGLCEYLIKTYTRPGETVLDSCMGCGSVGVACKNLGRRFVGIEIDPQWFAVAEHRLVEEKK